MPTWLQIYKLSLNVKKTHFIIFRNRQLKIRSVPKIRIDNKLIAQVWSTKFLGVLINHNLTWTDHMTTVLNKTSNIPGIIHKLSNILLNDVLHTLYNTLTAPYLSYCDIAWGLMILECIINYFKLKKCCAYAEGT